MIPNFLIAIVKNCVTVYFNNATLRLKSEIESLLDFFAL